MRTIITAVRALLGRATSPAGVWTLRTSVLHVISEEPLGAFVDAVVVFEVEPVFALRTCILSGTQLATDFAWDAFHQCDVELVACVLVAHV